MGTGLEKMTSRLFGQAPSQAAQKGVKRSSRQTPQGRKRRQQASQSDDDDEGDNAGSNVDDASGSHLSGPLPRPVHLTSL